MAQKFKRKNPIFILDPMGTKKLRWYGNDEETKQRELENQIRMKGIRK